MDSSIKRRIAALVAASAFTVGFGGIMAGSAFADDPATGCTDTSCTSTGTGTGTGGTAEGEGTGTGTGTGQAAGTGVGGDSSATGGDQTNEADQSNTSTNDNQSSAAATGGSGGSATGVGQSSGDANTTGGATTATIVVNVPGSSDKAAASTLPFVVTTPAAGPLNVTLALPADAAGKINSITGDNTVLINSIVAQITAKLRHDLKLTKAQNVKLTKALRKQMTSFSRSHRKVKVSLSLYRPDAPPRA